MSCRHVDRCEYDRSPGPVWVVDVLGYISEETIFKPMKIGGIIWKVSVNKEASEVRDL